MGVTNREGFLKVITDVSINNSKGMLCLELVARDCNGLVQRVAACLRKGLLSSLGVELQAIV